MRRAGEAEATAAAALGREDTCFRKVADHLRQMVVGHLEFAGDLVRRIGPAYIMGAHHQDPQRDIGKFRQAHFCFDPRKYLDFAV